MDQVLGLDNDDRPVLLIDVLSNLATETDVRELARRLAVLATPIPYGMLVDPDRVQIIRGSDLGGESGSFEFPTRDVVLRYDPDYTGLDVPFASGNVFTFYLRTLVQSWLSDVVDPWKEGTPPVPQAVARSGLLERLKEGVTFTSGSELAVIGHALR